MPVCSLGQISIDVLLFFVSLQVFLFYEHVDALFDDRHSGFEAWRQLKNANGSFIVSPCTRNDSNMSLIKHQIG